MAMAMKGLRLKSTYEQLVNVAVSDGLEHIKFPNRDAPFLRNGLFKSIRRRRHASNGRTAKETH